MGICYTKHGHVMFEISSMIQKSLRRSDSNSAYYAANEMVDRYRNYLWKRLLTVSLEDCHDMVTAEIYKLKDLDATDKSNTEYVAKAVSILLQTRKSRDADYFACNYQNSWVKRDLSKYCKVTSEYSECLTRNGHVANDVKCYLISAIRNIDCESAGYASRELITRYPKFFWRSIMEEIKELGYTDLLEEVSYCQSAAETMGLKSLAAAKAIVLLMKTIKRNGTETLKANVCNNACDLKRYDNIRMEIPLYVYDCHTRIGKMRGKTKEDFIIEEQAALKPYEKGWFDKSSWERYLFLAKNGWDNPNIVEAPMPSKKSLKGIECGVVQQSLF